MKIKHILTQKDIDTLNKFKAGDTFTVSIDFDQSVQLSATDEPGDDLVGGRPDDRHPPKPPVP